MESINAILKIEVSAEGLELLDDSIKCLQELVDNPCVETREKAREIISKAEEFAKIGNMQIKALKETLESKGTRIDK